MSWLSDIGDAVVGVGKSVVGSIFGGGSSSPSTGIGSKILGSLVSTAITGFALNKMMKSIANSQPAPTTTPPPPDTGVNIQLDPNPQAKVPVLYGTSTVSGILTDAVMSDDNLTMYYCLTICEKTGTKISDNTPSIIAFDVVYYNDQQIVLKSDGITVDYTIDRNGNVDTNLRDLVEIYCYNGSSTDQINVTGTGLGTTTYAYDVIPTWPSTNTMNDLVFAIIKMTYNKDKGTTSMPNMTFKVRNSMYMPGDCMYDYMTNTRYGAGIPLEDISVE